MPDTVRNRFEWKLRKETIPERGGGAAPYANYVRTRTQACIKQKTPEWGPFVLACLTRFERAAFRVGDNELLVSIIPKYLENSSY